MQPEKRRPCLFPGVALSVLLASSGALAAEQIGPPNSASAQDALHVAIDQAAERVLPRVVAWRRDFHENPELGNRESETAALVAAHLRSLDFDEVMAAEEALAARPTEATSQPSSS